MNTCDEGQGREAGVAGSGLWWRISVGWVAVLAVIGVVAVLFATARFGAGVSTDSVVYISAARNLQGGGGLVDFAGQRLVSFPPVFPGVLAFCSWVTRLDPMDVGRGLNAVIFGVLVLLPFVWWWWRRSLGGLVALALVPVFVLVSPWVFKTCVMVWSEPLFVLLTVMHLLTLACALRCGSLVMLCVSGVLCGLSALTRYVGVSSLLAGVLSVVLLSRGDWGGRWKRAGIFALVSGVPLMLWVVRNMVITGHAFGERVFVPGAVLRLPMLIWSFLSARGGGLSDVIYVAGGVVLVAWACYRVWRSDPECIRVLVPWFLLAVLQAVAVLAGSGTPDGWHNQLLVRYSAPFYVLVGVPCLLLVAEAVTGIGRELKYRYITSAACVAGGLALLGPSAVLTVECARHFNLAGPGDYSTERWRNNQTLAFVRQHRDFIRGRQVYSNAPDILYILCDVKSVTTPVAAELSKVRGTWPAAAGSFVVWLPERYRPYLVDIQELAREFAVSPVVTMPDGYIACASPAGAGVSRDGLLSVHTQETIGKALHFMPKFGVEISSAPDACSRGVAGQFARLLGGAGVDVKRGKRAGLDREKGQAFFFSAGEMPPESVLAVLRPLVDQYAMAPVFKLDASVPPSMLKVDIGFEK